MNKVHHEWRLQKATHPKSRYGEKLPSPQKTVASFPSARMLAAEVFVIALFLSSMEIVAVKKYLVGLAENMLQHHGNWLTVDEYMLQRNSAG